MLCLFVSTSDANPVQTNWNNSTKTPDQQRKMLVAEFLDMEFIPLEWAEDWDSLPAGIDPPRAPTTEEVDTILRPYP